MVVAIIAGRGGVGKTAQLVYFPKIYQPSKWGLLELKDVKSLDQIGMGYDNLTALDGKLLSDAEAILKRVESWRDEIIKDKGVNLKLIVIDGISDLRKLARDEWNSTPGNKKASGKNKHAWEMINNRVRGIINPLVNYGLYYSVHVFMTAEMKDNYENDIKTGREPDIKEWMEHDIDCLIEMKKDKGTEHYHCICDKAPMWSSGSFISDLRKGTGLLEVLSMQGLLEEG